MVTIALTVGDGGRSAGSAVRIGGGRSSTAIVRSMLKKVEMQLSLASLGMRRRMKGKR